MYCHHATICTGYSYSKQLATDVSKNIDSTMHNSSYCKNTNMITQCKLPVGIYTQLDSSCNKPCDLIGWNQVSKALRKPTT